MGLISIGVMNKMKAFVDKKYIGWGFEKIYNDCKDSYNDTHHRDITDLLLIDDNTFLSCSWDTTIKVWRY